MSVFTIADLHLSVAHPEKSMELFGSRWQNYESRLEKNWRSIVTDRDTVVIPGDISWAMNLQDALPDFVFLNSLPGTKLIGKGNHDFWWTTARKIHSFWQEHHLYTLHILYNNAYIRDDRVICGTRGWFIEEKLQNTVCKTDFEKLVNRENTRLELSLKEGKRQKELLNKDLPITVFLHFPPIWGDNVCEGLLSLMEAYRVEKCYFGHIHGSLRAEYPEEFRGIRFSLIASDALLFCPQLVR